MMKANHMLMPAVLLAALFIHPAMAQKQYGPGVTDTEIKIGQTMPYSGPASAFGTIGKTEAAYIRMLNEQGGVNGRKITLLSLDDGYSPPKTVEMTRKLVEEDQVLAIFDTLGTPTNAAIETYLNDKHVPQFAITGGQRFNDPSHYPWTMGVIASYVTEGRIYARYILQNIGDAKIGVLYQNDDLGRDYLAGLQDGLGDRAKSMIVNAVSYEVTDTTVESQIVTLQASGANVFFDASTPKFAAQAIRKSYEIGWHPQQFLALTAASIPATLVPAGLEKAVGIISSSPVKDSGDPTWANDKGMQDYLAFMKRYEPDADTGNLFAVAGYGFAQTMVYILQQCGDNLTRENVMHQAASMHDVEFPTLLPGIKLNTSPTHYRAYNQLQLEKFDGKRWVLFGDIIGE